MAAMTIAKALRAPTFRLTFTAEYLRRMARLEELVGEHGKGEGLVEWSLEEVRAFQLERIGRSGMVHVDGERYDLRTATDRGKLAASRRVEGRWWLRQGITVAELVAHPQVTVTESVDACEPAAIVA